MLSEKEKEELLLVARRTLEVYLPTRKVPEFDTVWDRLQQEGGAFVTLHKKGALRGCIGVFDSPDPLYRTVQRMAIASATQDPRFHHVDSTELPEVTIEISVLSPRRQITRLDEIIVGRHGLCIARGGLRGVLLPQVATDQKWNREEFLSHTCLKAGLPPDAWEKGGLVIEVFEAEVFGEKGKRTL